MSDIPAFIKPKKDKQLEFEIDTTEAQLGKALIAAKTTKETVENQLTRLNKEIERLETELTSLMESRDIDSFKSAGATFYIKAISFPNVKEGESDNLIQWLKSNGHGGLVKETVHPQTLRGWVNGQIETGEPLPPQLTVFTKRQVATRRKKEE